MKREKLNQERAEIRRRVYEELKGLTEDEMAGDQDRLCILTGYTVRQVNCSLYWLKQNRFAGKRCHGWWIALPAIDPCWIHGIERIQGICQLCERQARLELNSENEKPMCSLAETSHGQQKGTHNEKLSTTAT